MEELVLHIKYLVAENRILRGQVMGRVPLSDAERQTLAEIGTKLSSGVMSGWAVCSHTTTGRPHEFFDPSALRYAGSSHGCLDRWVDGH